jgi:hypothetical protein
MVFRHDIIGQSLERLRLLQDLYCEGLFEWGSPEHSEILLLEEFESFQIRRQVGSQLECNSPDLEAARGITAAIDGLAELLIGRRGYFLIAASAPRPAN